MIRVLVLSLLVLGSRSDLQDRLYEQNPFLNIDGIQPEPIKEYPKPEQEVQKGTLNENSTAVPERLITIEPPEVLDPKYLLKYCLQPNGLFPSRFCNKFVNCWDGNAIEQFCPPTLVFNPRGYCDYSYHVNCYGKPIAPFPKPGGHWPTDGSYQTATSDSSQSTSYRPPVEIPTAAPPLSHGEVIKYCLKPRGQFPSRICSKFVNCWDGIAYEQDCPTGLLFNAQKGYCDYAGNVRCHYAAKSAEPIAVLSPCLKPEGMFRNQTDCSKYFICSENEVQKRFSCPLGYLFNDKIGVCDLSDRVDCANSSPSEYTWPKAIVDPHLACQPGTIFKYDECNRVAICREGVTEIIKCPSGLAYDVTSNSCMDQNLAKC